MSEENIFSRRAFISGLISASFLGSGGRHLFGIPIPKRNQPRITGLSLTTYSLKPHMNRWWGKPTKGKMDMLDFLDFSSELGFDGVELTSYFFDSPINNDYLNRIKRKAHHLGLQITGGAMGNNFSHPPQSKVTKDQMAYFRQWVDHFSFLGAPVVRVFASRGLPKDHTQKQIVQNVVENLKIANEYASKKGIMIGLENHDIVRDIDLLLEILDQIDSPNIGVIWDSANLSPTPDPYKQLERIAPYAITAQIKVMTKVNGHDAPADFKKLIDILLSARYSGPVTLEYEEPEDPIHAIPGFIANVEKAIQAVTNKR